MNKELAEHGIYVEYESITLEQHIQSMNKIRMILNEGVVLDHCRHFLSKEEVSDILWSLELTNPHSEVREKIKKLLESYK